LSAKNLDDIPTAVGQVSLLITSVAEAEAFYGGVLGLRHLYTFGDLTFFACGETRLYLQAVPAERWTAGSVIYLQVADIHGARRRLTGKVEFLDSPHMIHRHADGTEEWMTFFHDPAGNTLALISQKAAD
jgi:catechol 2,3-dioxygenase-like lactoylglutathione lyase family enzyme